MKKLLTIQIIYISIISATGTWMMTNRSHGELSWTTIETENFNIHYHQGIRDIALKGALIAEEIRSILMKQVGLNTLPRLDIAFTSEDEYLQGFAFGTANYTIIWIDQNDAALWNGDEKWIRTVLAHELQHLVFFNVVKGPKWLPRPMDLLYSSIPPWVVEGFAEYFTEKWRPFRFELSHRGHVIRNTVHKIQDPHNDGFSKSLYFADRFGDSTIIKILNERNNIQLLDFKKSFKKHSGLSLKQFDEDWRRQMNTYYFGQRSQKEQLKEVGLVRKLPMKKVAAFDYFSDTLRIAMIGVISKGKRDLSLVVATRDTTKEKKIRIKREKKSLKTKEKPKKVKPKWKIKELDHGVFGEINVNLDVSPDGSSIIYPKYRYGENQSLGFDIWEVDIETKKKTLLTNSMRANYPKYSPDGTTILFVAHSNSVSQLFIMNRNGEDLKQLTSNKEDVQIITPAWSPDGNSIAFAQSDSDGFMDIHILNIETEGTFQITNSSESDAFPIWHPNGEKITYTGFYNNSPNLFTYDFTSNKTLQNTDLWNMYKSVQWNDELSTVTAMTLNTTDSSRVVEVDPSRIAKVSKVNMNPNFTSWVNKKPDNQIPEIDLTKSVRIIRETSYQPHKRVKHLGTIILPDERSLLYNGSYTDVLGRHSISSTFYTDYDIFHGAIFAYQNSTGSLFNGFWGINLYNDANFQLQFYNKNRSYLETLNGGNIWLKIPYNFGRSLSSNHTISSSLQLVKREILVGSDLPLSTVFEVPDEGKEGSVEVSYLYLNKRGSTRNFFAPNQGYGIQFSMKVASTSIWGQFDYNKIQFDQYNNKKLGPLSLFVRTRYEAMGGTPPSQETLGIVDIPNYYFVGAMTLGREYMSPRGYVGESRLGDRAYIGTFEIRAPELPINIFEFVKIFGIGNPTFALISDIGNAWLSGGKISDPITTAGYELRLSLNVAKVPLFIFSYGWAQEFKDWSDNKNPNQYLQMTLINPF